MLVKLFRDIYRKFLGKYYFQQAFGYICVDAGEVPGSLGSEIEAQMFRKLRKPNLWPIDEKYLGYSEDDLFDVIEFLYDYVSKPVKGDFHSWNDCGWHYYEFNKEDGCQEYQTAINDLLKDYDGGFELTLQGEILTLAEPGLQDLFDENLPAYDPPNVEDRVQSAIQKFRRYRSSNEDRKDAIRDLADVLEFLRPKAQEVISKKDEGDLFTIANGFGIRHHNATQRTDYDPAIWYPWMFYYYLATINACLRLIKNIN